MSRSFQSFSLFSALHNQELMVSALIWFEDQCDEFRHRRKAVAELI